MLVSVRKFPSAVKYVNISFVTSQCNSDIPEFFELENN